MKKFIVLLFSVSLLGVSFYGLLGNSYYLQLLFNLGMPFMYARTVLAVVLLGYVYIPSIRNNTSRALLSVSGILLIVLAVVSVGSPFLLGDSNTYMRPGDSFTLVEAGILSIILSAELSITKSGYTARRLYNAQPILNTNPQKESFNNPLSTETKKFKPWRSFKMALRKTAF